MTPKNINARELLSAAMSKSNSALSGSNEKMVEYFQRAVGGNCGFIVEGDIGKFAAYFAQAAAGGCATPLSEQGAGGACGFTIHGDYELAWIHKYFESALSGNCGFVLTAD